MTTLETVRAMLAWCTVINMGLLLWWLLAFLFLRDWMFKVHSRWFPMPRETFNAIHYSGMVLLKIGLFFFNLVPYLALRIVG